MWFRCRVLKAGPAEDGTIFVTLEDVAGGFPARWFKAVASMKREMLATALTALTTGHQVDVALTGTSEYSEIHRMYVARV